MPSSSYERMIVLPEDIYQSLLRQSEGARYKDSVAGNVQGGQVNHIEVGQNGKVVIKPHGGLNAETIDPKKKPKKRSSSPKPPNSLDFPPENLSRNDSVQPQREEMPVPPPPLLPPQSRLENLTDPPPPDSFHPPVIPKHFYPEDDTSFLLNQLDQPNAVVQPLPTENNIGPPRFESSRIPIRDDISSLPPQPPNNDSSLPGLPQFQSTPIPEANNSSFFTADQNESSMIIKRPQRSYIMKNNIGTQTGIPRVNRGTQAQVDQMSRGMQAFIPHSSIGVQASSRMRDAAVGSNNVRTSSVGVGDGMTNVSNTFTQTQETEGRENESMVEDREGEREDNLNIIIPENQDMESAVVPMQVQYPRFSDRQRLVIRRAINNRDRDRRFQPYANRNNNRIVDSFLPSSNIARSLAEMRNRFRATPIIEELEDDTESNRETSVPALALPPPSRMLALPPPSSSSNETSMNITEPPILALPEPEVIQNRALAPPPSMLALPPPADQSSLNLTQPPNVSLPESEAADQSNLNNNASVNEQFSTPAFTQRRQQAIQTDDTLNSTDQTFASAMSEDNTRPESIIEGVRTRSRAPIRDDVVRVRVPTDTEQVVDIMRNRSPLRQPVIRSLASVTGNNQVRVNVPIENNQIADIIRQPVLRQTPVDPIPLQPIEFDQSNGQDISSDVVQTQAHVEEANIQAIVDNAVQNRLDQIAQRTRRRLAANLSPSSVPRVQVSEPRDIITDYKRNEDDRLGTRRSLKQIARKPKLDKAVLRNKSARKPKRSYPLQIAREERLSALRGDKKIEIARKRTYQDRKKSSKKSSTSFDEPQSKKVMT